MAALRLSAIGLICTLLVSILSPITSAESAVELENPIWIAEMDLGLEALASGGENSQKIIVAGADGYARLIDGENPSEQIDLATPVDDTLRAIDWHPRGKTALLAGDSGAMLRYATEDHSVTTVSGSSQLGSLDMRGVAWNAAGNWAYIGGEDGWIWAYQEGEGGTGNFQLIISEEGSSVTGIACLNEVNVCAVSTESDGIALIDSRTEHTVHWIGSENRLWRGVSCDGGPLERCVAIGDGKGIGSITLNLENLDQSTIFTQIVPEVSGELTHVHARTTGELLISMAPFQIVAWDMGEVEAYGWVEHEDVMSNSSALAGERLIGTWATTTDENTGFIVTSYGGIIGFHPPAESSVWTDSLISYILGAVVLVAVPGVILGLIFMNSETLQRIYFARRNAKHEALETARIQKEKDAKRAARKKKSA